MLEKAAPGEVRVRSALLSVSDKTGVVDFARGLSELGVEIVSTGGTSRALADAGIPVRAIEEFTGFPEIMDGRVKTLHPKIHGGLLGRRDIDDEVMLTHGIEPIDLLVVNLYPFARAAANPATGFDALIEEIDIGGPSMVRAAAKNFEGVGVVVDPADYPEILAALEVALRRSTMYALAARPA